MIRAGTGAILAGGRSRRFGSDKRLAPWADGRLMEAPLAALARVFPLTLIAAKRPRELAFLESPVVRLVKDLSTKFHPLSGLAAALEACPTPRLFATAADMPLLKPALVKLLWRRRGSVVMPMWEGMPQPLCAVYARTALPALRRLLSRGAPMRAAAELPGALLVPEKEWRAADRRGDSFRDADTPGDLKRLHSERKASMG